MGGGEVNKNLTNFSVIFLRLRIRKETILNFPKQDAPEHFSYQPIVNNAMRNLLRAELGERGEVMMATDQLGIIQSAGVLIVNLR